MFVYYLNVSDNADVQCWGGTILVNKNTGPTTQFLSFRQHATIQVT